MSKYAELASLLESECSNNTLLPAKKRRVRSKAAIERDRDSKVFSRPEPNSDEREGMGGALKAGSSVSWGALFPNQQVPSYEYWRNFK